MANYFFITDCFLPATTRKKFIYWPISFFHHCNKAYDWATFLVITAAKNMIGWMLTVLHNWCHCSLTHRSKCILQLWNYCYRCGCIKYVNVIKNIKVKEGRNVLALFISPLFLLPVASITICWLGSLGFPPGNFVAVNRNIYH